jgi:hypothetical protein
MASDPIYVSCTACGNRGMVDGARCPVCNGQGHVVQPAAAEPEVATAEEAPVKLDRLKVADLRAIAEKAGLETTGTKADLVERIQGASAPVEPEPEPAVAEPEVAA